MMSKTLLAQGFEKKRKVDFPRTFNSRAKLLKNFLRKRF